jgi:hypothetical protein
MYSVAIAVDVMLMIAHVAVTNPSFLNITDIPFSGGFCLLFVALSQTTLSGSFTTRLRTNEAP